MTTLRNPGPADPFTMEARLCDDAGMVSGEYLDAYNRGRHSDDLWSPFPCTGHAHIGRQHIRCTSPAHGVPPVVQVFGPDPAGEEARLLHEWITLNEHWSTCNFCGHLSAAGESPVAEHECPVRLRALVSRLTREREAMGEVVATIRSLLDTLRLYEPDVATRQRAALARVDATLSTLTPAKE